MADKFVDTGWKRVQDQVGKGTLRGRLHVNQLYAQDQHENPTYAHDDGGMKYLTRPLMANVQRYLAQIAALTLTSGPRIGMIRAMDHLNDAMQSAAPKEHGYLGRSGQVTVVDNGAVVHKSGPRVKRLSKAELNAIVAGEPGV